MFSYRIFILCSMFAILFSCRPEKAKIEFIDIKESDWGTPTHVMIERGYFHSKKSLDTIANQLTGDTLIPVQINESKIIIKKLEPLHIELKTVNEVEDFYITRIGFRTDTFLYDVKNYYGKLFLILISKSASSYAFELKNENTGVSETSNISFPVFNIEGYAVGDEVNRKDINVLSSDQFGTSLTEEAMMKNNNNVLLKVKAGRYIEEIQWINISNSEAQNIVGRLNTIFTYAPDIEFLTDENKSEAENIIHYYWSENEVSILLAKAIELGDSEDVWSLTYTNLIVSNILNNYLNSTADNL